MRDYLNNLKRDLNENSNEQVTITVSRKDLEQLVQAYENLLEKKND